MYTITWLYENDKLQQRLLRKEFFCNIAYSYSLQGSASVKFRWGGKFNYDFM